MDVVKTPPRTRHMFVLHIRPDRVDEYVAEHMSVDPALLQEFRRAGIRNYTICLNGATAVGYLEADDVDAALVAVGATPASQSWETRMQELLVERVPAKGASALQEIFRFD